MITVITEKSTPETLGPQASPAINACARVLSLSLKLKPAGEEEPAKALPPPCSGHKASAKAQPLAEALEAAQAGRIPWRAFDLFARIQTFAQMGHVPTHAALASSMQCSVGHMRRLLSDLVAAQLVERQYIDGRIQPIPKFQMEPPVQEAPIVEPPKPSAAYTVEVNPPEAWRARLLAASPACLGQRLAPSVAERLSRLFAQHQPDDLAPSKWAALGRALSPLPYLSSLCQPSGKLVDEARVPKAPPAPIPPRRAETPTQEKTRPAQDSPPVGEPHTVNAKARRDFLAKIMEESPSGTKPIPKTQRPNAYDPRTPAPIDRRRALDVGPVDSLRERALDVVERGNGPRLPFRAPSGDL